MICDVEEEEERGILACRDGGLAGMRSLVTRPLSRELYLG